MKTCRDYRYRYREGMTRREKIQFAGLQAVGLAYTMALAGIAWGLT